MGTQANGASCGGNDSTYLGSEGPGCFSSHTILAGEAATKLTIELLLVEGLSVGMSSEFRETVDFLGIGSGVRICASRHRQASGGLTCRGMQGACLGKKSRRLLNIIRLAVEFGGFQSSSSIFRDSV